LNIVINNSTFNTVHVDRDPLADSCLVECTPEQVPRKTVAIRPRTTNMLQPSGFKPKIAQVQPKTSREATNAFYSRQKNDSQ